MIANITENTVIVKTYAKDDVTPCCPSMGTMLSNTHNRFKPDTLSVQFMGRMVDLKYCPFCGEPITTVVAEGTTETRIR